MTIVITALATFLVTVLAGVVLDYIRNARPKISYSVKDAVPIELDGKCIGAYQVSFSNGSKRVVKDVSCHVKAGRARLRDGGVSAPQGMQYSATEVDSGMQISIPYLSGRRVTGNDNWREFWFSSTNSGRCNTISPGYQCRDSRIAAGNIVKLSTGVLHCRGRCWACSRWHRRNNHSPSRNCIYKPQGRLRFLCVCCRIAASCGALFDLERLKLL